MADLTVRGARSILAVLSVLAISGPIHAQSHSSLEPASTPKPAKAPVTAIVPAENLELRDALPEAAQSHFDVARMLFEAEDYVGAFLKFNLAYDISKEPRLLWSLAVCEKAQHHYSRALPLIERFLVEAKPSADSARRQEAEDLAKLITNFVGQVHIETPVVGAKVLVDDIEIGRTPMLEPIQVDMGAHRITLTKRGHKTVTRSINVRGKETDEHLTIPMERDLPAATLEVVSGAGHWISLDGGIVGHDRWQGPVSPGKHVITVSKADHKPREVPVDLSDGGRVTMWVEAQALDPSERSSRWPLLAILGAATATIAVVAYYSLAPQKAETPPKVEGKLDTIHVNGLTATAWR